MRVMYYLTIYLHARANNHTDIFYWLFAPLVVFITSQSLCEGHAESVFFFKIRENTPRFNEFTCKSIHHSATETVIVNMRDFLNQIRNIIDSCGV